LEQNLGGLVTCSVVAPLKKRPISGVRLTRVKDKNGEWQRVRRQLAVKLQGWADLENALLLVGTPVSFAAVDDDGRKLN